MGRKRNELVPIGEVFSDLDDGPVKALRDATPQAVHHFTRFDQVNQLIEAGEADPDMGFMARLMALCSLPRTNPGNRLQYKRVNGPYTLGMSAGINNKLPYGNFPPPVAGLGVHRSGADPKPRARPGEVALGVHEDVGDRQRQWREPWRTDTAPQPDETALPLQHFAELRG